jgi:hypothetical protein
MIVDNASNEVVNMVEWDGVTAWAPPPGHRVVIAPPDTDIGDTIVGAAVVKKPPPPPVQPTPSKFDLIEQRLAALEAKVK